MADHFAEQTIAAALTAVTGLATPAAVYRDYAYDVDASALPALVVLQGIDEPVEDGNQNIQKQDHYLEFYVDIITAVATSVSPPTTVANQVRKEVHIALMADTTLGTAFAFGLEYVSTEAPGIEAGELPMCRIRTVWGINYRSSYLDPSIS